jgi:Icc-related predicted phosphoesterase
VKRQLRLFYASDIHGSERAFRKFLNAAKFYSAKALVFGGDLTGKALIPLVETRQGHFEGHLYGEPRVVDTPEELATLEDHIRLGGLYPYRTTPDEVRALDADPELLHTTFRRVMRETAERWVTMADERLRAAGIPVLMMLGNDDEPDVREVISQGSWITEGEGRIVDLDGYQVLSYGYSTTTPWHSPREVSEDEMAANLSAMSAQVDPTRPLLLNLHNPPFGVGIDLAPRMTDDLRVISSGGQQEVGPVGSVAVKNAIQALQPVLSLHGHIHESRGSARLGRTIALNAGSAYTEGVLQGVIVNLDGDKVRNHQFVTG